MMAADLNLLDTPALQRGLVGFVPFMRTSGLRNDASVPFFVLAEHQALWELLDHRSCLVEGPPGSGKSTAVWLWLLRHVKQTGECAHWFHFSKTDPVTVVSITRQAAPNGDQVLAFSSSLRPRSDPFGGDWSCVPVDVCVVDGVTDLNLDMVGDSWLLFAPINPEQLADCHMIWVSSQQVVVGRENFQRNGMQRHINFTWTDDQIVAYASTFDLPRQQDFINDVIGGVPTGRIVPGQEVTFLKALEIKTYFVGNSVRWIFGMSMAEALDDLTHFVEAIDDAKVLQGGLSGSRSKRAVNHVIAMDRCAIAGQSGSFKIASSFIMEVLSANLGMAAIRVMYSSHWVRNNPSVHGFVFEWDILTRLDKSKRLELITVDGDVIVWTIVKKVRLAEFARTGVTADRMLVCPEKWNHPEYDGLFIYRAQEGIHLVAWNASEASTHSGKVSKLLTLLEAFSQREHTAINFVTVRFLFLVPTEELHVFKMSSDCDCILAKSQLVAWGFRGFEVVGTARSTNFM